MSLCSPALGCPPTRNMFQMRCAPAVNRTQYKGPLTHEYFIYAADNAPM